MGEMKTLGERLKASRLQQDVSQVELSDLSGASQATIAALEKGNTKRSGYLTQIAKALNVDPYWLETGQGQMRSEANFQSQPVAEWDENTPLGSDEIEIPHYTEVEVCAGASEGTTLEQTDRKIRMAKSSARKAGASLSGCFSFNVSGDSMAERIPDGSRCTADSTKTQIKDGKIYVFRHGTLRRTKYLRRLPDGGLLIRSHNPEYPDELLSPEDMEQIEILGWVWEWSTMERW